MSAYWTTRLAYTGAPAKKNALSGDVSEHSLIILTQHNSETEASSYILSKTAAAEYPQGHTDVHAEIFPPKEA